MRLARAWRRDERARDGDRGPARELVDDAVSKLVSSWEGSLRARHIIRDGRGTHLRKLSGSSFPPATKTWSAGALPSVSLTNEKRFFGWTWATQPRTVTSTSGAGSVRSV